MRSLLHILSWPSAALLLLSAPSASAPVPQGDQFRFQYAAKIVCASSELASRLGIVPQAYSTTINIHNPTDSLALIGKKIALTVPPGYERPGRIIQITTQPEVLKPDQALATDCLDIMRRTALPNQFEGFVVIYSDRPLDVVEVYAVPGGVDVMQVPERPRHVF